GFDDLVAVHASSTTSVIRLFDGRSGRLVLTRRQDGHALVRPLTAGRPSLLIVTQQAGGGLSVERVSGSGHALWQHAFTANVLAATTPVGVQRCGGKDRYIVLTRTTAGVDVVQAVDLATGEDSTVGPTAPLDPGHEAFVGDDITGDACQELFVVVPPVRPARDEAGLPAGTRRPQRRWPVELRQAGRRGARRAYGPR
ncbi:MAG: hypothetical protein ABR549_05750, partial [Mycobacteriales bacterium]